MGYTILRKILRILLRFSTILEIVPSMPLHSHSGGASKNSMKAKAIELRRISSLTTSWKSLAPTAEFSSASMANVISQGSSARPVVSTFCFLVGRGLGGNVGVVLCFRCGLSPFLLNRGIKAHYFLDRNFRTLKLLMISTD